MKRHRVWLGALAALAALPAVAKVDDPNDLIRGRWYATEAIIFERAEAVDPEAEALLREHGRAWPGTVRAFAEPEPWRIASLDPLTRACLEFPRLEVAPPTESSETELAEGDAAEPLPSAEHEPTSPIATIPPPTIDPRLSPNPLLDLLSAAARQQQAQRRDSYRWLPAQTHALKTEARRLRNSEGLDIIWHGRWMQPVPSRSAGEPLMLTVQSTPGRGRLAGTLQVTLGRYLHFDAELWLEQAPESEAAAPYMQLKQARTLRSDELHYLDHPRMGILVRIDPLPPSPALVQALQAWKASAEG